MKIIAIISIAFSLLGAFTAKAQSDTITVMHYNLLNYGNYEFDCTSTNNLSTTKNGYMKTIVQHVKPDIVTCNEMGVSSSYQTDLLNNAFNTDGVNYYSSVALTYFNGANIKNAFYYNNLKFGYHSKRTIYTTPRQTDIVRLYYKAYNLSQTQDTCYINFVVVHLHSTDTVSRKQATETIMTQLGMAYHNSGNYILSGDLNLDASSETTYKNLLNWSNASIRFFDPVNQPGTWASNYSFRQYHTQSTHNGTTACAASGGLDDRFDFILASSNIMNGTNHCKYITSSYKTIGQDGNHYNKTLLDAPTNNSAPSAVINALYNMSDHLPVMLKLHIDQDNVSDIDIRNQDKIDFNFVNPAEEFLTILSGNADQFEYCELISIIGKSVKRINLNESSQVYIGDIANGIYFIKVKTKSNQIVVKRIIKQ